jgi:Arf-GAP/GTPase/ANK repeat/PH domain-containing protein 1/3
MANNTRSMIPSSQVQITNTSFIKSEIERFESVHPSIYSVYELVEEIKDQPTLQTQIRDHVMVLEGKLKKKQQRVFFRFIC